MLALPPGPGSYCLVLHAADSNRLTIGKLGTFDFPAGWYLYMGSALGGLRGRLLRHLRADRRRHWHVDHLHPPMRPVAIRWVAFPNTAAEPRRLECVWANAALTCAEATLPAPRFGASDCRCRAHLVHLPSRTAVDRLLAALPIPPDASSGLLELSDREGLGRH